MFKSNPTKLAAAVFATVLAGSTAFAASDDFEMIDRNDVGQLSIEELKTHYPVVDRVLFDTYVDEPAEGMSEAEYIAFEADHKANRVPTEDR